MLLADAPSPWSQATQRMFHVERPTVYSAPHERSSPRFAGAFAAGCGGTVTTSLELQPGPIALFGSPTRWALLAQARAEGRTWFYGDHGYFGRDTYFRVTRNAFQHNGRSAETVDPTRFMRFQRPVQPWRAGGSHILICPNSRVWHGLFDRDVDRLIYDTVTILRKATDRPIRVRMKGDPRPIAHDLANAWATVTWTSAAAIDGLIAGVPAFVLDPIGAAYRMGDWNLRRIETPYFPKDREQFCAVLANHQWTLEELARGDAWRALTINNS